MYKLNYNKNTPSRCIYFLSTDYSPNSFFFTFWPPPYQIPIYIHIIHPIQLIHYQQEEPGKKERVFPGNRKGRGPNPGSGPSIASDRHWPYPEETKPRNGRVGEFGCRKSVAFVSWGDNGLVYNGGWFLVTDCSLFYFWVGIYFFLQCVIRFFFVFLACILLSRFTIYIFIFFTLMNHL